MSHRDLIRVATKPPPIAAEDEMELPISTVSARQRLSRLVRTAARERALTSGGWGGGSGFCPLEAAVAVLTSTVRTTALSVGSAAAGALVSAGDQDLFDVFFFLLDIDGSSAIDLQRFEAVVSDVARAKRQDADGGSAMPAGVDVVITRLLRLQTVFGSGESLRVDELELLAGHAADHVARRHGAVLTFQGLLGFLSCAAVAGGASGRHKATQRRERRSLLHSVRLNLEADGVADSQRPFDDVLGTDSKGKGRAGSPIVVVDSSKLHAWVRKRVGQDLCQDEVLALLRDMKQQSPRPTPAPKEAGASEAEAGDLWLPEDCRVDRRCLEAFVHDRSRDKDKDSADKRSSSASAQRVIIDVVVGQVAPVAPLGYAYRKVAVSSSTDSCHGGLNLSGGLLPGPPSFIWFLRSSGDSLDPDETHADDGEAKAGDAERPASVSAATRLAPVVELRLEEEKVSSDLVAAGYVLVGPAGPKARFLWLRRARNASEGRELALTELSFTAGDARKMEDEMHLPPRDHVQGRDRKSGGSGQAGGRSRHKAHGYGGSSSGDGKAAWVPVGGRANGNMCLLRSMRRPGRRPSGEDDDEDDDHQVDGAKSDGQRDDGEDLRAPLPGKRDLNLWCRRVSSSLLPSDRLSLCLQSWSANTKKRELESAVRRQLRNLAPSCALLGDGPHRNRVDVAVDVHRLFNEATNGGLLLGPKQWARVLALAGLPVHLDDAAYLYRRLAVAGDSGPSATTQSGRSSVGPSPMPLGIPQGTFATFMSLSDDELEGVLDLLRHDLRRGWGIGRHVTADLKARQASALHEALGAAVHAMHGQHVKHGGLTSEHLSVLLQACPSLGSFGHLSREELLRLCRRVDPNFRGTLDLGRFLRFVTDDRTTTTTLANLGSSEGGGVEDAAGVSGHVERVVAGAEALVDATAALLGKPKMGTLDQAAAEVWRGLCDARHRRLGIPLLPRRQTVNMFRCTGDGNAAFRLVVLEAEDLGVAVEQRSIFSSSSSHSGHGGRIDRLSHWEAQQLCFLIAPTNPSGCVARRDFLNFVALGRARLRPLDVLVDEASSGKLLKGLMQSYDEWVGAAKKAVDAQRTGKKADEREKLEKASTAKAAAFATEADSAVKAVGSLLGFRVRPGTDPSLRLADLARHPWASDAATTAAAHNDDDSDGGRRRKDGSDQGNHEDDGDGDNGDVGGPAAPFRSVNELALLVLHCGADSCREDDSALAGGDSGMQRNGDDDSEDDEDHASLDSGSEGDDGDDRRANKGHGKGRHGRHGRSGTAPEPPKPLGLAAPLAKGAGLSAAPSHVHVRVKLRSLLEGLCRRRFGSVPHVVTTVSGLAAPPEAAAAAAEAAAKHGSVEKAPAPKAASPEEGLRLAVGDALAEKFLSTVVRQAAAKQRDRKETPGDGWLGGCGAAVVSLLQCFAHPSIDPYPSRGFVGLRDFRKALALAGITVSAEEVEDGAEPFLQPNGHAATLPLVDYERFLQLLRRAWLVEWDKDGGSKESSKESGELKDARQLLKLLRAFYKAMLAALATADPDADASGEGSAHLLARTVERLAKRSDDLGDGRVGPGAFLDALRVAGEQTAALGSKAKVEWGGGEDLPLAGGRARRIFRRLLDHFDDDGDGRAGVDELIALLERGIVGDLAGEKRHSLLDASGAEARGMSSSSRHRHPLSDTLGSGDFSSDEDGDGDWLLSGIGGGKSNPLLSATSNGRRRVNVAVEKEVSSHPSVAKLCAAVAQKWKGQPDRDALKLYLSRHMRHDGTVAEARFVKFLRKAGLTSSLNRRELAAVLAVMDPTKSHTVPVAMVNDHVIKDAPKSKEEEDKKKESEVDPKEKAKAEAKEEAEKAAKKKLKARELERLAKHVIEVATERGALPGSGALVPAFKHFDPRAKGVVSSGTAADVLAFLGCDLIEEECQVLWAACEPPLEGKVDYHSLDKFLTSKTAPPAGTGPKPTLSDDRSGHVSFAMPGQSSPSNSSRFFGGAAAAPVSTIRRPHRSGLLDASLLSQTYEDAPSEDGDSQNIELLLRLAKVAWSLGSDEAAAWGRAFDFGTFVSLRCGDRSNEGVAELVDVAAALERLGLHLDRPTAQAMTNVFGVPRSDGLIDYKALGDFVHAHGAPKKGSSPKAVRKEKDKEAQSGGAGGGGGSEAPGVTSLLRLIGPTIMAQQRLGLDAAMAFEMHDPSSLGVCSVEAFVDSLKSFDLRLSIDHLHLLVTSFAARGGEFVDYRSFLRAAATTQQSQDQGGGFMRDPRGASAALAPRPKPPHSGMRRRDETTLSRTDLSASWSGYQPPPIVTGSDSPRFSHDYATSGFASPSKQAAIAIWGAGTPLTQKGKIPSHTAASLSEAGKWMCLTCLFADNSARRDKCDVCGAGNPSGPSGSNYTVQQECGSCHFLSSAFATTCDMCNRPLPGASVPAQEKREERRGLPRPYEQESSFAISRGGPAPRRHIQRPDGSGWNDGSDSD